MYSLILHGGRRRSLELQKCRNLSVVLVKLLQNAFAFSNSFSSACAADASSLQDGRKGKTFTVSYLVDSLGLTTKLAESISRKVRSEGKGDPDSVLNLLTSYGFTDSQIGDIITDYPRLLIADAEKSLAPKLQFLQSRGGGRATTTTSELTEILTKVPKILGIKKDKAISRYYDFVKEIVEADKSSKFVTLCHSSLTQGSAQKNIFRNVSVLRELGVPQRFLFPLLRSTYQPLCGKENFEESLKKVVEMGFNPKTSRFVKALQAFYRVNDKGLEEKINAYKRLGFDVGDVWAMFKKWPPCLYFSKKNILNSIETFVGLGFSRDESKIMVKCFPQCIGLSAETVKKKTQFVVKQMNWPLKALASQPQVLGYSLEKRIVPRCNVIKALMSKGLLGKGSALPSVATVFPITDQAFLNNYVMKHDDKELVAELMAIFTRHF